MHQAVWTLLGSFILQNLVALAGQETPAIVSTDQYGYDRGLPGTEIPHVDKQTDLRLGSRVRNWR